jgi:hypothetical protein
MAVTYKVLGQAAPAAVTEVDLYTVPASTSAVVSTVVITNRGASAGTFRISISVGGGATVFKDYIAYDMSLGGNKTITLTLGITMAAADIMRVYASTFNFSFSAFGSEKT